MNNKKVNIKDNWPIIGIIGYKNSGKTTLMTNIIKELTKKKYSVFAIKKAHHHFSIDMPNTDSWKFRQAGAYGSAIFSDNRIAITIEKNESKIDFSDMIQKLPKSDLFILESYKKLDIPKIEMRDCNKNYDIKKSLYGNYPNIRAIVGPHSEEEADKISVFEHLDIVSISEFILKTLKIPRKS